MLGSKTQSSLQEQRVVLTTELSLQPPAGSFDVTVCDMGCCEQNSYAIPQDLACAYLGQPVLWGLASLWSLHPGQLSFMLVSESLFPMHVRMQ